MSHTTVDSSKNFDLGIANFYDNGKTLKFPPENLRKIEISIEEGNIEIPVGNAKLIGNTLVTSNGNELNIPNGEKAVKENREKAAKSERIVHSKATAQKGMEMAD